MTKVENGTRLVINPRGKELTSWIHFDNLYPLDVNEEQTFGNVDIQTIKSVHGPIIIPFIGFKINKYLKSRN